MNPETAIFVILDTAHSPPFTGGQKGVLFAPPCRNLSRFPPSLTGGMQGGFSVFQPAKH
jgi:hypothetical protein